jgi:hypothetical protein
MTDPIARDLAWWHAQEAKARKHERLEQWAELEAALDDMLAAAALDAHIEGLRNWKIRYAQAIMRAKKEAAKTSRVHPWIPRVRIS